MATRFYLPSTGSPAVSPAFGSAWEVTTNADRRKMVVLAGQIDSAMTNKDGAGDTTTTDQLLRQYVSEPLAAQNISGTIKGVVRMVGTHANLGRIAVRVAKCDSAGNNVVEIMAFQSSSRGTSPPFQTTTLTNRRLEQGSSDFSLELTATDVDEGDHLIVELGYNDASTNVARFCSLNFGDDSASDLAEDETSTTADNPWVEFSMDIDFDAGAAAPVITDVDTDEAFTATQTNVVITGTDFDTAVVTLRDGALSVTQSIDSQNATTIQFDADIGTAPGVRYGSRTLRVTNADDQFDEQAVTVNLPTGKNYVTAGTLAPGTQDGIYAASQDYASGVALSLEAAAATISPPRRLRFNSGDDISGTIFAIVGFDENSDPAEESVSGPNNGQTYSSKHWSSITSITPNATSATDEVEVGAMTTRLEASPDYATGHQIEWSAVTGTGVDIDDVTVNDDLTYSYGDGVESFDHRGHNVNDGWGSSATITIEEEGAVPVITSSSLVDGVEGISYSDFVLATGEGPFEFAATGLPAWATINSTTGEITGTPTEEGTTSVSVTATNLYGVSAPVVLDLEVLPSSSVTLLFVSGVRVNEDGAIVYHSSDATGFVNGNPVLFPDGKLAIEP